MSNDTYEAKARELAAIHIREHYEAEECTHETCVMLRRNLTEVVSQALRAAHAAGHQAGRSEAFEEAVEAARNKLGSVGVCDAIRALAKAKTDE